MSKRDKWIAGTVVVVVPVVVFASVLVYIWPRPTIPNEPPVEMAEPVFISGNEWEVEVAHVSEAKNRSLVDFRAILMRNGTIEAEMNPLASGSSDEIAFTDGGSQGKLDADDFFLLTCEPGSYHELVIVFRGSGNVKGSVSWWT
jgi:hypothetical protein